MRRLEGKAAIITGAGAGQGRAGAVLFAAEGAGIVAVDIDEGAVHDTIGLIEQAGGRGVAVVGDVADPEVHRRAVQEAVSSFGGLHVLYCNAGMVARGPDGDIGLEEISLATLDRILAVNLTGGLPWMQAWDPCHCGERRRLCDHYRLRGGARWPDAKPRARVRSEWCARELPFARGRSARR